MDNDRTLLGQAVAGNHDALSELLNQHGPAVAASLQIDGIWRTTLEPDDVMQVTYLEAFECIERFDLERPEPFRSWLRRIAENNLRDAIRGLTRQKQPDPRKRVTFGATEDSMIDLYEMVGVTTTTPSRQVGRDELSRILQGVIDGLPEDYRAVLRLYDLEGRDIGEVADELNRSSGAVHMLRARAHDQLRERLSAAAIYFDSSA